MRGSVRRVREVAIIFNRHSPLGPTKNRLLAGITLRQVAGPDTFGHRTDTARIDRLEIDKADRLW